MYLCMTHESFLEGCFSWMATGMLVSLPLCCWLFLALPVSSFSPLLQILLLFKSFFSLDLVIIFHLFKMLIQNNCMLVGLTVASRKGKKGKLFWYRIRNLIPSYRNSPFDGSQGEGWWKSSHLASVLWKSINVCPLISWRFGSSYSPVPRLPCPTLFPLLQSPAPAVNPLTLWNPALQAIRAPFQVTPMVKNWHSSIGLLCYYLQAFSRPWCMLDVFSGILNPLM